MGDEAAAAASVNAGTHTGDSPAADQPNPDPLTATVHNSVRQLRADAWSSLGELTHRPPGEHEVARLEELFQLLTPIENCWAFPGKAGLAELRGLHETGDHRRLSQRAEELNRALSTDSYHHAASPPIPADGPAEADDTAGYDPGAPTSKPYFEVLVVGELDDDEERALRDELHAAAP